MCVGGLALKKRSVGYKFTHFLAWTKAIPFSGSGERGRFFSLKLLIVTNDTICRWLKEENWRCDRTAVTKKSVVINLWLLLQNSYVSPKHPLTHSCALFHQPKSSKKMKARKIPIKRQRVKAGFLALHHNPMRKV